MNTLGPPSAGKRVQAVDMALEGVAPVLTTQLDACVVKSVRESELRSGQERAVLANAK